jgi:hypothetical protein
VEAHAEEERARGLNLNGRHVGGVDLDGGRVVEAHYVNLDDKCAGGVDLNGRRTVVAHTEEERGTDVEAVAVALRHTWRRSEHRWVCDREMTGLGFRGSGTLRKKNSSNEED